MALKGGRPVNRQISVTLFVRHGDEERAIAFYQDALGAEVMLRHALPTGALAGATLAIGDSVISVAGANPKRDADPTLGGPRSPSVLGTSAAIFDLYVDDVDTAMRRAVEAGATIRNQIEDATWGDRIGAFVDPFGHIWLLAAAREQVDAVEVPERERQAVARLARNERRAEVPLGGE